jgi:hypothetical protein
MMEVPAVTVYCGRCGEPEATGDHGVCRRALTLEPPRYCAHCRRRLIVQVLPTGWTGRCSVHGESSVHGQSSVPGESR